MPQTRGYPADGDTLAGRILLPTVFVGLIANDVAIPHA
jgi:hypothetical protein